MSVFTRAVAFGLVAIGVFLMGCGRSSPGQSSQQVELEHFDGAIDHTDSTSDISKSKLYVRASKHLEDGDVEAAKLLYRKAIEEYPDDPAGYSALGASLYFEHKHEEARIQYLRAIELDALCVVSLYGLGCVAYEQKQYDVAIEYLSKALDIADGDGNCHRVLGMVFEAIGDIPKAVSHYEKALALNASDDSAREALRRLKME